MKRTDAFLLAAPLLLVACHGESTKIATSTSAVVNCSGAYCVSAPPKTTLGCPGRRQVTALPAAVLSCPDAPGWTKSNVFPLATVAELRRYCVYDFNGSTPPTTSDIGNIAHGPKPDCNVVAAQAPSSWQQNNASIYEQAYFDQMERVEPLPSVTLLPPLQAPQSTRLMIVDSAINSAFPEPGDGQLDHGQIMGEIGRKLGCPNGSTSPGCRVDVATILALRLERMNQQLVPNTTDGGYLGRLTDTANAIVRAVDYALAQPTQGNIVINLSVGWDEHWGGSISSGGWSTLPAPARAVYSAIAYAGCNGALVVAASGNLAGGPFPAPGAAFPAQWETEPAPDDARCDDLGNQTVNPVGSYRPFLYAVGGVDGRDRPLLLERPGSRPRLVAPAEHVAMTRTPTPHSATLSGTSVGAAGVSAVASTVWAYHPTWSRHQVMDLVYNRAVPLNHSVDLCNGSCPAQTRRVSMCRSVRRACVLRGDCATLPVCGPAVVGADRAATGLTFNNPVPTPVNFGGAAGATAVSVGSPCYMTVHTADPTTLDNPCPSTQYHTPNAVPHLVPQPIVIGCPTCGLFEDPGLLLAIGISPEAPNNLSDAKLLIVDIYNGEEYYDLSEIPSGNIQGLFFEVRNLPFKLSEVAKASIEFVVDGQYSTSDPISIMYD